jgi:hypothetical protein
MTTTTEDTTVTTTIGISDGMSWNAGGTMTTTATGEARRAEANDWADEGDYPCDAPVTVTLVARDESGREIDRWQHQIPDSACSGS